MRKAWVEGRNREGGRKAVRKARGKETGRVKGTEEVRGGRRE